MTCYCILAGTSACSSCFNRISSYSYTYTTHTTPSDITITQKNNLIIVNNNYFIQETVKRVDK